MSTPQQVWLAGEYRGHTPKGEIAWDLVGVFDTEAKAVAACTKPLHFVGPVTVNAKAPDEVVSWVGCRYPFIQPR